MDLVTRIVVKMDPGARIETGRGLPNDTVVAVYQL
jgi:hypothetical protein